MSFLFALHEHEKTSNDNNERAIEELYNLHG